MKHSKLALCVSVIGGMIFLTTSYADITKNAKEPGEIMLFNFSEMENMDDWLIVNDGVMGGLSKSTFMLKNSGVAVFSGNVTLENNGGFASTRTKAMPFQLEGFKGIHIRIKGDGKKYQFRIRTNDRFDGVSYRHHFETTVNQWQTVSLPFNDFVPVFRGRILRDVDPISPKDIQQLGILIADNQTDDFQLLVEWIKSYR